MVCENLSVKVVESQSVRLEELDREVLEVVVEAMRRADDFVSGEVYLDGLQNVLAEPEFFETDVARPALRLLEERSYLDEFLGEVLTPQIGGVQVVIAGEGHWDDLESGTRKEPRRSINFNSHGNASPEGVSGLRARICFSPDLPPSPNGRSTTRPLADSPSED